MKNKLKYLLLTSVMSFSFANAEQECTIMKECCPEEFVTFTEYDCDIESGYRYVTIGTGPIILIPNVGVGYRERCGKFGWDTSLNFSTIGYAHQLSTHIVGHYYLSPYQNSAYTGFGLMGSGILTNKGRGGFTLSPDFVFGKEFQKTNDSRHFLEMHVAIPTLWMGHRSEVTYLPMMYIKYGISF